MVVSQEYISVLQDQWSAWTNDPLELVVRAPGRINIIGEHLDYNSGVVLPAAIAQSVRIAIGLRNDTALHASSIAFSETLTVEAAQSCEAAVGSWQRMVWEAVLLVRSEFEIHNGFNILIQSDLPIGAGLSSSAALSVGLIKALYTIAGKSIEPLDLALKAQGLEQQATGVQCGLMDHYACCFGKENQVIKLDCRDNSHEMIPADLAGCELLLINSHVKHKLAESAYNKRRMECESALGKIGSMQGTPRIWQALSLDHVLRAKHLLSPDEFLRAAYIVEEMQCVQQACRALVNGDMELLGQLLNEGHQGLKRQFQVTCAETDFLAEQLNSIEGVLGARQMGGGFGGCVLVLAKSASLNTDTLNPLFEMYRSEFNIEAEYIPVRIGEGVGLIRVES